MLTVLAKRKSEKYLGSVDDIIGEVKDYFGGSKEEGKSRLPSIYEVTKTIIKPGGTKRIDSVSFISSIGSGYITASIHLALTKQLHILAVVSRDSSVCASVKRALTGKPRSKGINGYRLVLEVEDFVSGVLWQSSQGWELEDEAGCQYKSASISNMFLDGSGPSDQFYYALSEDYSHYQIVETEDPELRPVFESYVNDKWIKSGILSVYPDAADASYRKELDKRVVCQKRRYHRMSEEGKVCSECNKVFGDEQEVSYREVGSEETETLIYGCVQELDDSEIDTSPKEEGDCIDSHRKMPKEEEIEKSVDNSSSDLEAECNSSVFSVVYFENEHHLAEKFVPMDLTLIEGQGDSLNPKDPIVSLASYDEEYLVEQSFTDDSEII